MNIVGSDRRGSSGAWALPWALISLACASEDSSRELSWPQLVTLSVREASVESKGLVLVEGRLGEPGDIVLTQAQVLSLSSQTGATMCVVGKVEQLALVPATCASDNWVERIYLSAAFPHDLESSGARGSAFLVRTTNAAQHYRVRVIGDSVDERSTASVRFEYEPVR